MAGHRKSRGSGITLVSRHRARREVLDRKTEEAGSAGERLSAAVDYLRGAAHRLGPRATPTVDRAAELIVVLVDELYQSVIKERSRR